MSAQHTPAPWWTTESGVRDRGGYVHLKITATRYDGQDERYANDVAERKANEELIAAAPELLDALRDIVEGSRLDQFNRNDDGLQDHGGGYNFQARIDAARAVIAKATNGVEDSPVLPSSPLTLTPAMRAEAAAFAAATCLDGESLEQAEVI